MSKIATASECNSIAVENVFPITNGNELRCPSYAEIIATGYIEVNGVYDTNQLVQLADLNHKDQGFTVTNIGTHLIEFLFAVPGLATPINVPNNAEIFSCLSGRSLTFENSTVNYVINFGDNDGFYESALLQYGTQISIWLRRDGSSAWVTMFNNIVSEGLVITIQ